jgi:hypothetical protein
LEVGAEGGFKLDLRQDHDPGKWKLKGAVRTETYRCHYCQHQSHIGAGWAREEVKLETRSALKVHPLRERGLTFNSSDKGGDKERGPKQTV